MKNSDRPLDEDIEASLETLLADCDAALGRGEDPTALLERLKDFPAAARDQFNAAYESLCSVKDMLPGRSLSMHFPRVFGKFRLLRLLGQGGFGLVFLAEDSALGRKVAVKVPRLHQLAAPESSERFVREARAAAALEHPHLAPIFEIGQAEGLTYLASAYCEGPTLAQWLKVRNTGVSIREAAELVELLARATAYMHRQGVVHRDLKPSNVLLFPKHAGQTSLSAGAAGKTDKSGPLAEYVPRITDFGLASQGEQIAELTRTGMMAGTAAYMSPEQAWGSTKDVGPATDTYALGVILYELLTGRPPFHCENDLETLGRAKEEDPIAPRGIRTETPRDLETICLKCLEKSPARRYSGAGALADDLRRFLDGLPITARRVGTVERSIKSMRRRPLVTVMTAITAITLAALVAIVTLAFPERPAVTNQASDDPETRAQLAKADALQNSARNVLYAQTVQKAGKLFLDNELSQLHEILRGSIPEPGQRDVRGFEWHYLWRFAHRDRVLRGHTASLSHVAFSAHGGLCATASEREKKIIVWRLPEGRKIAEYPLELPKIFRLSLSADGSRLVAAFIQHRRRSSTSDDAGNDESVVIKAWDLAAGTVVAERSFPWRASVTVSPDGRQVAGILDPHPDTWEELQIAEIDQDGRRTLVRTENVDLHNPAFSPDGKLIALGYRSAGQTQAQLVDVTSGDLVGKLALELDSTDFIFAPAFSADSNQLAIGSNLGHGAIFVQFREQGTIHELSFDPSGSELAIKVIPPKSSNRIRLRSPRTGALLRDITPTTYHVNNFAVSADGHTIALCGSDHLLHLQQLKPAPVADHLPPPLPRGEAWAVAFSPRAQILAGGYDNEDGHDTGTLKLWDLKRTNARVLAGHQGTVTAIGYSPDGATLATASYDKRVGLWHAADGRHLGWLEGHTEPVRAVAFSPDGRLLASGGSDQEIKLWNVVERKLIARWIAHESPIRALAFSPNGRQFASASNEECTTIWDVGTHHELFRLVDEHNVACLAYSPNGTLLATGNESFDVKMWDPADGKLKQTLKGHTGKLRALAFSADGRTLATGGEDKVVRLWSVATWGEILALPTEHFINGLAFDRDGKTLAAALHDGTVKIWSADSR
jgi:WD40 repeat protein/serine/threonine protein kinase